MVNNSGLLELVLKVFTRTIQLKEMEDRSLLTVIYLKATLKMEKPMEKDYFSNHQDKGMKVIG